MNTSSTCRQINVNRAGEHLLHLLKTQRELGRWTPPPPVDKSTWTGQVNTSSTCWQINVNLAGEHFLHLLTNQRELGRWTPPPPVDKSTCIGQVNTSTCRYIIVDWALSAYTFFKCTRFQDSPHEHTHTNTHTHTYLRAKELKKRFLQRDRFSRKM